MIDVLYIFGTVLRKQTSAACFTKDGVSTGSCAASTPILKMRDHPSWAFLLFFAFRWFRCSQQEPNPYNVAPNTVYYVLTAENAG